MKTKRCLLLLPMGGAPVGSPHHPLLLRTQQDLHIWGSQIGPPLDLFFEKRTLTGPLTRWTDAGRSLVLLATSQGEREERLHPKGTSEAPLPRMDLAQRKTFLGPGLPSRGTCRKRVATIQVSRPFRVPPKHAMQPLSVKPPSLRGPLVPS